MKLKPSSTVTFIVLIVLLIDQVMKIWVKTHMFYGQEISILGQDWAKIHFVENEGMAYGKEIGGEYGKLILSLFRLAACAGLIYYIRFLIKEKVKRGMLVSFALILAGAMGNIIDSAFYGMIFSASPMHGNIIATYFPDAGGYESFLHGKVVDMFHFPLFSGTYPDWVPFVGVNKHFTFFSPVFNIADAAITIGVFNILLFQRDFFKSESTTTQRVSEEAIISLENPEQNQ